MSTKLVYRNKSNGQFAKSPARRSQELLDELYRAFDFFNDKFAEGKLPKVVITIQESGRKNALGWFGNGFWSDSITGNGVPEINLSAEYLARGPSGLLETLLHEMAHLYNAVVEEIRDCSSGQYHNKHFKRAAELFGLTVKRTHNKGWAYTQLGEEAEKAIKEFNPNREVYKSLRRKRMGSNAEKRYISLIVSAAHEGALKEAIEKSGLSQREFVEDAIVSAIDYYTRDVK